MKKQNKTAVTITTNLAPLWDVRTELQTLTGILGAVLYLSGGPRTDADDDPGRIDVIEGLIQIQETVARCAEQLHDAIKGGTVSEVTKVTDN